MKVLSCLALMACSVFAGEPIDGKVAANLKTYDCGEYEVNRHLIPVGTIFRLKFSFRYDIIEKEDGKHFCGVESYQTSDVRRKRGSGSRWSSLRALIPEDGLVWFTKVPSGLESKSSFTVIARAEDEKSGAHISLLGRQIKTTMKGSEVVW